MNIFKQFWVSLYAPKEIAKTRFQGIGKTILYIFLLVLISTLPTFIYTSLNIKEGFQSMKVALENEIPAFTITDDALRTEADIQEPIKYKGKTFDIFFDPNGELTANDVEVSSKNALALLKQELVLVSNGQAQVQPYDALNGFTITDQDLKSFLGQANEVMAIVIAIWCITIFIFAAALKFIEVLVMALIAKLLAGYYYPKLQYRHFFRMVAYCTTLPTLFFTIMDFLQVSVIAASLVNWGVTFTLLYLTLKEIPKPKQKKA
ncbi:MAG: DUF1189 domain-containing protein [Bacillus sp. (in: firmicutes)]